MQAPYAPGVSTLAVCGWTERTPALLAVLESRGLAPVAVGDRSAAALVSAASMLRDHPCHPSRYQHPREMLRRAAGQTVLLDMTDAAAEAAALAQRRSPVLVVGEAIEADTLDMLARTGAVASVVRPLWWRAALRAAIEATRPLTRIREVLLTVEDARPARATADDLATLAVRLAGVDVESVVATAYGASRDWTNSIISEIRFVDGLTALLVAREAPAFRVEAEIASFTTAIEVNGDHTGGTLTTTAAGSTLRSAVVEDHPETRAIDDALDELACGGAEAARLFEEAALLRAIQRSLDGAVDFARPGPRWEVIPGGGHRSTPRRGHLHLV